MVLVVELSTSVNLLLRGLLYRGSVDCLKQTINKEGFVALYKGVKVEFCVVGYLNFIAFRISSLLDSDGALVANILAQLRTNSVIAGRRRVLNRFSIVELFYSFIAFFMEALPSKYF